MCARVAWNNLRTEYVIVIIIVVVIIFIVTDVSVMRF